MRFWLDRGAAGIRIDVAHALGKDRTYPDAVPTARTRQRDVPHPHPYLGPRRDPSDHASWRAHPRRVRRPDDGRRGVGQAGATAAVPPPRRVPPGVRVRSASSARGTPATFSSDHRDIVRRAHAVGSVPTWVLSNHDVDATRDPVRPAAGRRPGAWSLDGPYDVLDEASRCAAGQGGDPVDPRPARLDVHVPGRGARAPGGRGTFPSDVARGSDLAQLRQAEKGRDGCRVPIPWEPTGPSLGFGTGEPWLPQPPAFAELAVSVQEDDPASMLHLYRSAIAIRTELLIGDAEIEMLRERSDRDCLSPRRRHAMHREHGSRSGAAARG